MAAAPHRTVSRALRILEFLAARPEGVGLGDVVAHLQAPRSSVHGFLRGLVAEGYVSEGGSPPVYRLGHGAHALLVSAETSITELTRPLREQLLRDIDETVTLGVEVADSVVYLESLAPTHSVSYRAPLRVRRPLWPTSCGKIFLARRADPEAVLRDQLGDDDLAAARAELDLVRTTGVAFNRRESMTEVSAVAVGVEHQGRLLGAISIAGPSGRVKDRLEGYAHEVHALLATRGTEGPGPRAVPK